MARKEEQQYTPEFQRKDSHAVEFRLEDGSVAGRLEINHAHMDTLSVGDRRALEELFVGFCVITGKLVENKTELNAVGARVSDAIAMLLHHITPAAEKLDQAVEDGTKRIKEGRSLGE